MNKQRGQTNKQTNKQTDFANQGDTISRQAAIDALGGNVIVTSRESAQAVMDYIRGCADRIRSLPSAQPELIEKAAYIRGFEQGRTQGMIDTKAEEVAQTNLQPTCNQLATDTISRQAAIDAFTHKWDGMVTSVFDVINSLPSAQPEQRKGEWIDEGFYADGHGAHAFRCSECGGHIIEYDADPFCRWCGADMRGEQDENR